jgi:hypothetical protein
MNRAGRRSRRGRLGCEETHRVSHRFGIHLNGAGPCTAGYICSQASHIPNVV